MKRLLLLFTFISLTIATFSQSPQGINYQAVIRDGSGGILGNTNIGLKISIIQNSPLGNIVYEEVFNPITNDFGVVNVVIGQGTQVTGSFTTIDWASGPYFVEIAADENGGANYTSLGTQQLMSVPYALYAENSGGNNSFSAPNITTGSPSNITVNSVTLNGSVQANNLITTYSFQFSTNINDFSQWEFPKASNLNTVSGNQITNVSFDNTTLSPGTTYYYRLLGINAIDTTFGAIQSFTTPSSAPIVTTYNDSIYLNTDVRLYGSVNPNGPNSTTVYFEYGTTTSLGSTITATPSPISGSTNIGINSNFISGLVNGTTYYYRIVANNMVYGTVYGNILSFYYP